MIGLIIGVSSILAAFAPHAYAQCEVVSRCPENFLPAPVKPADKAASLKAIQAAAAALEKEKRATEALKLQRGLIEDELNAKRSIWSFAKITPADVEKAAETNPEYLRLKNALLFATMEDFSAHNEAIRQVAIDYQLTPPTIDFANDPRAANGNMVAKPWLPHFSRAEKFDEATGAWRQRNDQDLADDIRKNSFVAGNQIIKGRPMAALTMGNGDMRFFEQAFENPDGLALLIYHETSHWVDIAAKSGGFRDSDLPEVSYRTEQRAYEHQATYASQLGLNAEWFRQLAAQYKNQALACENQHLTWSDVKSRYPHWIGADRKGLLAQAPAESDPIPGDEALLRSKMAEAKALVDEQRNFREIQQELARQESNKPRPVELNPDDRSSPNYANVVPTSPDPGKNASTKPTPIFGLPEIIQIRDIAKRACISPTSISDDDLVAIDWSQIRKITDMRRYRAILSPCQQRVFDRLLSFGQSWSPGARITSDAVRSAAAEPAVNAPIGGVAPPQQTHDPVWNNVRPFIPH